MNLQVLGEFTAYVRGTANEHRATKSIHSTFMFFIPTGCFVISSIRQGTVADCTRQVNSIFLHEGNVLCVLDAS